MSDTKPEASSPTGPQSSLAKHFETAVCEPKLYSLWEQSGIFKPEAASSQPGETPPLFNIAMPPPNANGELHLGHAFGYTVMDIFGRFHRLLGERVLLLPGKDHAGIQTQVVFEKKLRAEKIDYKTIPTEELYKRCYDFCTDRANYMRAQEKTLAISADWSRELFTLDPRLTDIIYDTFTAMWKDGLIYRGKRIINWSVFSQTAISDVEVEYKEQKGSLWYLCYKFKNPNPQQVRKETITLPDGRTVKVGELGMITATTRPETMLGDTALAVNPADPRYKDLIGAEVLVPLVHRTIKIVGDKRVDMAYGTGVVKVTPAHDFLDYDIGQDHKLEIIQVIGKDGKMTAEAGAKYAGMTTVDARTAVVADLEANGQLLGISEMMHKVPIGERGKDIIEPLISEQWFVAVDSPKLSLKARALEFIRAGKIKIHPPRFQVLFEQWLENLHDWNISRQLWWGHRLPVWYRGEETYVGKTAPTGDGWRQDPDTFDTWFSSGQWAFSTFAGQGMLDLQNPSKNKDVFPSHTMVMGRDILFFWACRMVLLTAYRLNDVPWKNIFFTGIIRDEHGQKMSKSKGNGIEPGDVIARHGTDALRLALVMGASPGNDINLSEKKIEGYSKFVNKLWNAAKLIDIKTAAEAGSPAPQKMQSITSPLLTSQWLRHELGALHHAATAKLNNYEISIVADELYSFGWTVFCDWYLEMMKVLIDSGTPEIKAEIQELSLSSFKQLLVLLHPFIPYVTEEIYQQLPKLHGKKVAGKPELLATAQWSAGAPVVAAGSAEQAKRAIAELFEMVTVVRSVKAALQIPHQRIRVALKVTSEMPLDSERTLLFTELGRVDLGDAASIPEANALMKPYSGGVIVLDVPDKDSYRKLLEKDLVQNKATVAMITKKLAGDFAAHAKPEVVERERERLAQAAQAILTLERELAGV